MASWAFLLLASLPAWCEPIPDASESLRRAERELDQAKSLAEQRVSQAVTACDSLRRQQELHPDPTAEDAFPAERAAAHDSCDSAFGEAFRANGALDDALRRYKHEVGLWVVAGTFSNRKARMPSIAMGYLNDHESVASNQGLEAAIRILEEEVGARAGMTSAREKSRRGRKLAWGVCALIGLMSLAAAFALRPPAPAVPPAAGSQTVLPPAPPPRACPPRVLGGGQYRVLGESAPDLLGQVFAAEDALTRTRVVIRCVRQEFHQRGRELDGFLKQARKLTKLHHPGIVEVRWVFVEDGRFYLVSEAAAGPTLAERLRESGRLRLPEAVHVCRELLLALEYVQSMGMIHGNLTPLSVFATCDGVVKLQDFGIGFEATKVAALHAREAFLNSSPYMAPEQELGRTGPTSDVFSVGVILYEMATGTRPFPGPDFLSQKRAGSFKPASSLVPSLPKELDELIARALAPDPAARCGGAGDLLRELEERFG